MRLTIHSDFHLEMKEPHNWPKITTPADVLIMAGDMFLLNYLDPDHPRNKHLQNWLNQICSRYAKVFYIAGNHEFYQNDINASQNYAWLPLNFTMLGFNNLYHEDYNGVRFVGATYWTDLNSQDYPIQTMIVEQSLNDYNYITKNNKKLTIDDLYKIHKTEKAILQKLTNESDLPVIVITHHAPTLECDKVHKDSEVTQGFCSVKGANGFNSKKIKLWIHGHTHVNHSTTIQEGIKVITNQCGYESESYKNGYNAHFSIEIT